MVMINNFILFSGIISTQLLNSGPDISQSAGTQCLYGISSRFSICKEVWEHDLSSPRRRVYDAFIFFQLSAHHADPYKG